MNDRPFEWYSLFQRICLMYLLYIVYQIFMSTFFTVITQTNTQIYTQSLGATPTTCIVWKLGNVDKCLSPFKYTMWWWLAVYHNVIYMNENCIKNIATSLHLLNLPTPSPKNNKNVFFFFVLYWTKFVEEILNPNNCNNSSFSLFFRVCRGRVNLLWK